MDLKDIGWSSFFEDAFQAYSPGTMCPARVAREDRGAYLLLAEQGELSGGVSGRFRHQAGTREHYPAVGDWVVIDVIPDERKATVQDILPRKSSFVRKVAGDKTEGQIVAANIDTVFIVGGLDGGRNFNLRRIERYLALAWESTVNPVLILNKTDLCDNTDSFIAEAQGIAFGVPICPVSAMTHDGLDALREHIVPGSTTAFLGSSGVGKSALINALLGEDRQDVKSQRKGDRQGRHTTTRREMILLNEGGIVIDTPGMRELQMWGEEESVGQAFPELEKLAEGCRFGDCTHSAEPGCAVQDAIAKGSLDEERLESYHKLQREMAHIERKRNARGSLNDKGRWKGVSKEIKRLYKGKGIK